jgi:uncharacterized protein YaiI (UPF0178 family)
MIQILIDADACPVKDETYRVAARYDVPVVVVSNSPIRVPAVPLISRKIVSDAFDAYHISTVAIHRAFSHI